jgi:hypothetical protein
VAAEDKDDLGVTLGIALALLVVGVVGLAVWFFTSLNLL